MQTSNRRPTPSGHAQRRRAVRRTLGERRGVFRGSVAASLGDHRGCARSCQGAGRREASQVWWLSRKAYAPLGPNASGLLGAGRIAPFTRQADTGRERR